MKKLALAVLGVASFAGSALAADLGARPIYKAPPVAAPAMSWTGCYVGAGGGYSMWNQDTSVTDPTGAVAQSNTTVGGRGWFGTVQGGCDYQFAQSWVIGAFADGNWGSAKGDFSVPAQFIVGSEKMTSQWAVGGKLGYLPFDRLMVFGTAGFTQAHFDSVNFNDAASGAPANDYINSQTYSGGFVGTGYEYAFNWLPGFFWKTEYRYSWFGSKDIPLYSLPGPAVIDTIHSKKQVQDIRSELVWRFNWTR